ncbi:dihydroneopterin aldolase [Enorma phocaeensis]|uniref:dihydroneopterin aldolase n=1 Tax=Enorma phocaeensis TaxID=1871019 RepID=UPI0023563664|nr:dihydroneopterin aldolase [Enorma phocaeensis]
MEDAKKGLPEDTSRGEEKGLAHRVKAGLPVSRRELAVADPDSLALADKVIIDGLEVFANHGVYPAEQELGQKFVVSAVLYTSLHTAGVGDDLRASVDYGEACHAIDAFVREHTFKLIEAVAEGLASELLERYPQVFGVKVCVKKPWAPIGLPLTSAGVEIVRLR